MSLPKLITQNSFGVYKVSLGSEESTWFQLWINTRHACAEARTGQSEVPAGSCLNHSEQVIHTFWRTSLFHGCPCCKQMLLLLLMLLSFKTALQNSCLFKPVQQRIREEKKSWGLYFPVPYGSYLGTKRGHQVRYCGC